MKKYIFLFLSTLVTVSATSKVRKEYSADSLLSRWVIDFNLLGGLSTQTFTTVNSASNYLNGLNINTGNLKYENGSAFAADAQIGFFFGKKRHFGFGTGFMYLSQIGDAKLSDYHVEYQGTDAAGNIYRQVVTGDNLKEDITSSNMNIPLVLKYKDRFSKHWGFAVDAGALINLQTMNATTTHATFNYEAIYKVTNNGDAGQVSVYDNSPVPSSGDLLVTQAEFLKNNPNGNLQNYFNAEHEAGFNVGLNQSPGKANNNVYYNKESVGLLVKPSFNYFLSDNVELDFGVFYIWQPYQNNSQAGYVLTEGLGGTYNSVLKNVTKINDQVYGINIGARFFLGRACMPVSVSSVTRNEPTQCGMYDGSIVLHGLPPDRPVLLDYSKNGKDVGKYVVNVEPDSSVKIDSLGAGAYTGIVATIRKRGASVKDVSLEDPIMHVSSQTTTNPQMPGSYDGSVSFNGLYAGSSVSINYAFNGTTHEPFTGTVNADHSITINNLGEGKYTGILITTSKCSANSNDFILQAPVPPVIQPPVIPVSTVTDISTPILYDVNEYVIHTGYNPEIEEAFKELTDNKGSTLTIDGNADSTGIEAENRPLSLNRAKAIKKELVEKGIKSSRITTRGHGSTLPVATNRTYEGKQENRNAVMKIKYKDTEIISDNQ